jgi:hypothetical protein
MVDGPNLYRYCRNNPVKVNDPNGMDPPDDDRVRITPLVTTLSPTGVAGHVQFHNFLSDDRSVSGRLSISTRLRSSFILDVPRLGLNTTGFADVSATVGADTSTGVGGMSFKGGLVLGDISGLNLTVTGEGTGQIPITEQSRLRGLPGASGNLRLGGSLATGNFSLASFRARAALDSGRFEGELDATSFGNFGRLRLDATGTLDANGSISSLTSVNANADIAVPGLVSLTARGSGRQTSDGSLAVTASSDVRLFGLPSLHAEGTGTVSAEGADFAGVFYGPGPLYTSYITGSFDLSTRRGISASAGVFGLTYSPSLTLTDPNPTSAGFRAIAGEPRNPWTPGGLTLGASFFQYSQGNFNYISAGFMPDLSERIINNPRVGVTAQWHF